MRELRASWRDWYVVTLVAGVIAFCLGPSLLGFRTLLSVNQLTAFYPWQAINGPNLTGHEACTGDTVDSVMPGIAHVRTELFSGHLAAWQSLIGGGSALSGLPDLGLLDPLSLPYWILPLRLAPAFVALLVFVVAAGGTFLFLRLLGLSRAASTLAGLIFATSGFMVMWTNWPQTRVAALVPALFWATERLIQRVRLRDAALVAIVVASMLLGGFPQVTVYALCLAAGYLIVRIVLLRRSDHGPSGRIFGLAAGSVVVGAGLAMVQILPFLYFYQHAALAYRSSNSGANLGFAYLVTTVAPNAFGLCINGTQTLGRQGPVEFVSYLGAAAVVLAALGAAATIIYRRRETRTASGYFVAAIIVMLVLGWGSLSVLHLVQHLPGFSGNFIGRIRSVSGFGLAILAAVGFDAVFTPGTLRREAAARLTSARVWTLLVVAVAIVMGAVAAWRADRFAASLHASSAFLHAVWIPALLLAAAVAGLAAARWGPAWARTAAFLVIPILVAAQGAQFFHTVLPGDSDRDFYPVTGAHTFLASHLGHDRFASSDSTMYPSTALYYGLRTPTGHAFEESSWTDLLQAVDGGVMRSPTFADFSNGINVQNVSRQPILDQMGVDYYVTPPYELSGRDLPLPPSSGSIAVRSQSPACSVPSQPLRGVSFGLAGPLKTLSPAGVTVDLTVRDAGQVITSGRYVGRKVPAGTEISIALPGEDLPTTGTASVTLSARVGRTAIPLVLAANHGSAACAGVLPLADGLKLAYADSGSIIYQRSTAVPRIHWASRSTVISNPAAQVTALAAGLPADDVVLDQSGPVASGQGAAVSVETDDGDEIQATVTAAGNGYLVVADAMQEAGWSVTIDGHAAKLVAANHAMAAVDVPAGNHRIDFRYRAPEQVSGLAISALSLVVMIGLFVWERRRAGRPQSRSSDGAGQPDDQSLRRRDGEWSEPTRRRPGGPRGSPR